MKKTNLLILLIFVTSLTRATDNKFSQAMIKNIELVYQATTSEEFQHAVNVFDRIASAEKTRWEPYYYSSYGNMMMALRENDASKKGKYLDLALEAVQKAKALKPDESEIFVMEGFVYMISLTVDPATRAQQFSGMAFDSYHKALTLNPENPRALALMAQLEFGTAQFFKTSTTEACNTNSQALEKFSSQKNDNPIAPVWGKNVAEEMKTRCLPSPQKEK
ncbi:MAG: hypothetical protein JSS93_00680 [Bacteroidetes bacterium]|nr:hypothetical protein [Bacteroidota bacterium]